ncbi:MAG: hypothetical protein KGD65_09130 [Candidatus Lokiarchaeota archaeon]|nr:hypothetical protein [Candidatus Lokiarchaeota archaeon]
MPDKFSVDMTLGDLLADPVSEKFIRENLAALVDSPQAQMAMGMSLRQIQEYSESMNPGQWTKEQLDMLDAGLKAL